MGKVFQHTKHVALWNECIKVFKKDIPICNIDELKEIALKRLKITKDVYCRCYACDYVGKNDRCEEVCPLDWGKNHQHCSEESTPYGALEDMLYNNCYTKDMLEEAIKLCKQIRDLPIKKGVEYE